MTSQYRQLQAVYDSQAVTDGDGVKIQRSVTRGRLQTFDPFLLLDEFRSDDAADYIGGFPEHPHRGFETVTYMLQGRMRHRDHMGNEGVISSGGVQWMSAGRGVLHSEMPEQTQGLLHGFQLWINLPASEKMSKPQYRDFTAEQIPSISLENGTTVKVIAGEFKQNQECTQGAVVGVSTQPDYFDIHLPKDTGIDIEVDESKTVVVYVYEGSVAIGGTEGSYRCLKSQQLGLLTNGNRVQLHSKDASCFLLLAGVPLNEPIANWGPFVMNTQEQIEQAIEDYRRGRLV